MQRFCRGVSFAFSMAMVVVGAAQAAAVDPNDVTAEYQKVWVQTGDNLPATDLAELRNYKFLIVPGFLSNLTDQLQKIPYAAKSGFGHYFSETEKWLTSNQIDWQTVQVQSEETPLYNAQIIKDAVASTNKPVIILSHSKGGLDTLQALLEGTQIAGWISLNSPFYGTPIASLVANNSFFRFIVGEVLQWLGGTEESLESMKTETRTPEMEKNLSIIQELGKKIHILSFASWIEKDKKGSPLNLSRAYLARKGYQSDGLVPLDSQILPGSDYMKVGGIDHLLAVAPAQYMSLDRDHFNSTLFAMLAHRLRPAVKSVATAQ